MIDNNSCYIGKSKLDGDETHVLELSFSEVIENSFKFNHIFRNLNHKIL